LKHVVRPIRSRRAASERQGDDPTRTVAELGRFDEQALYLLDRSRFLRMRTYPASTKEQAAVTFKKTFGFHTLAAWCANTAECLAMLLRPGNAGSNTVADHITVLTEALTQIPGSSRAKILVRVDARGPPTTC
jgi:hypothetical protein